MDDLLTSTSDAPAALLEGPGVGPTNGSTSASAAAMIVFEDVRKVYEPDVVAHDHRGRGRRR